MSATICRVCNEEYPQPDHECQMKPTQPTFREMAEKLLLQLNEDRCGPSAGLVLIEMTLKLAAETARREVVEECAEIVGAAYALSIANGPYDYNDMKLLVADVRALAQKS